MPAILKPANLSLTWASGGDVLNPGDTKYASGWAVEIPARQWFNYLDNRQDTALAHINQHGVVVWDATTEYQGGKSYVQGITNGTIYRCIQTHINQDPELDVGNVYWIIAFASAGDFYTKAETDGLYLAKTQNLADLTNTATARTNLSVYSQAQTYTKAEVDAKTTVASTAQAAALTSNTTIMTPLRTKEAFNATGAAPFFAVRAWANFNGVTTTTIRGSGNIGSITRTDVGLYDVLFTTPMPDANYSVSGNSTQSATSPGAEADTFVYYNRSAGGFTIQTFKGNSIVGDSAEISFMVVR
jgi:hypothetical protein